jgi:hypothetical protein
LFYIVSAAVVLYMKRSREAGIGIYDHD